MPKGGWTFELPGLAQRTGLAFGSKDQKKKEVSDAEAMAALKSIGNVIQQKGFSKCNLMQFGSSGGKKGGGGYGMHTICAWRPQRPCFALTYGIEQAYSFEVEYASWSGCDVVGLDPTVNHRAMLAPHVYFIKWAAPSVPTGLACRMTPSTSTHLPGTHTERIIMKRNCSDLYVEAPKPRANDWIAVGPARLAQLLVPGPQPVPLIKMDCEGCEYSLYNDTMNSQPRFWERVEQIAIEVHLSRLWAADDATFLEYGRFLALLLRAGHRLRDAKFAFCSGGEPMGLTPLVASSGYMQSPRPHCENLLFAQSLRSLPQR